MVLVRDVYRPDKAGLYDRLRADIQIQILILTLALALAPALTRRPLLTFSSRCC